MLTLNEKNYIINTNKLKERLFLTMMSFLTAYISVIIFVFGTVIGSFLNVLIYRLPIGLDFKVGKSMCTTCKHDLAWYDLFPLFSWIFLGGKCRYCKAKISSRYPIVEALNGILYVLIYLFICGGNAIEGLSLTLLGYMVVASCLIVTAWIDFEHQIIPDSMWISIFIGGAFIVIDTVIKGTFSKEFIIGKVIGLFAVSGLFFLIGVLSKGAWMGGGDVKLMAAAGFVLGWKSVIVSLFLWAFYGVLFSIIRKIVSKKEMSGVIPFGPFLAIGIMLSAFVGEYIFNLYINMFI